MSGSASSVATATASPRCCGCSPAGGAGRRPDHPQPRTRLGDGRPARRPRRGRDRRCRGHRRARRARWAADSGRASRRHLLGGLDLERSVAGLSGGERRRVVAGRGCCSGRSTSCFSTSPPTTSTSRASTGSHVTWSARGAPSSWSPTTGGSSTRCVRRRGRCTTPQVDRYEGGYAAYVLAKAERTGRRRPRRRGGRT